MEIIGFRYFNVFGPRQDPLGPYAAVIPKFISLMMEGMTNLKSMEMASKAVISHILAMCSTEISLP